MKPNNLKLLIFFIPLFFLILGFLYKDTFYLIIAIGSLLLSLLFFMPEKSVTLRFKFFRPTFGKIKKIFFSNYQMLKNRLFPTKKIHPKRVHQGWS
ncbi:hypothetical protein HZA75_04520 [Candidatus Roizmanbacteria bacterium]|nr:hypothetical protein [Candidatus Roizmanbacteria bacterium]